LSGSFLIKFISIFLDEEIQEETVFMVNLDMLEKLGIR